MRSVQHSCTIVASWFTPDHIYFFVVFVCLVVFIWFCFKLIREARSLKFSLFLVSLFSIIFVVLAGITGIFVSIYFDSSIPPTANYHDLNAQIKNFCWLDKARRYCPHTDSQVITAAPDSVRQYLHDAHITYVYTTKTNQYTLIVRNDSNSDEAAIFDSRLPYVSHYGYNTPGTRGVDFYDASIAPNCDGTYRIINPPPLPGPWEKIH